MTATIVACEITIAVNAIRVKGAATTSRIVAPTRAGTGGPTSVRSDRDTSSGSGRRRTAVFNIATANPTAPNSHGPEYRSRPNQASPAASAGSISSGPNTAPNVD